MAGLKEWENWKAVNDGLSSVEFRQYTSGDDEVDFIDEVVNAFRGISSSHGGEQVDATTYKAHGYPRATFDMPSKKSQQTCEIADLLFDIRVKINGRSEEHRALLSQSKISAGAQEKWNIQLNQHYLLTFLPPFSSTELGAGAGAKRYHLTDPNHCFSNYSLASRHDQPTFASCISVGRNLWNWDYTQDDGTYRHRIERGHLQTAVGFTSALLNGNAGRDVMANQGCRALVEDMIQYAKSSSGPSPQPDGGVPQSVDREGGFRVIQIRIDREE